MEEDRRLLINRLSLANLILNLLGTQRFEDLIPRVGVLQDGEIRKGISGKGGIVEGYKNLDPEMPEGQKVLYRIER